VQKLLTLLVMNNAVR